MQLMKYTKKTYHYDMDLIDVFPIIKEKAKKIGNLLEINEEEGYMVIDVSVKLLSLKEMINPTIIIAIFQKVSEGKTNLTLFAVSQDGMIGMKSPEKSIEKLEKLISEIK
ncbi:MAG: hypothetical protein DRN57_07025 [Thermoplasmata archaeon]|nr:MAG: hypothetical protein DRN57_07025 [Thermoplasmata archaeon]